MVVPASKPFITFQGAGRDATVIEWHDRASDRGPDGQQLRTYHTASVTVFASHFTARNISFKVSVLIILLSGTTTISLKQPEVYYQICTASLYKRWELKSHELNIWTFVMYLLIIIEARFVIVITFVHLFDNFFSGMK